ncbi:hypothetical protein IMCC3317_30660 [Kordia antarctica]|uniref:Uncharacterized protein n=1 Tax=Kordia antarctica TaxID=1218801 RepID=A0A7L4ZM74_9FLAO|nr:hypothetical protein [Kordia antarctica]QHI37685.1 hypothetical protein IMCC3317_30660 [Kordia antarctica]
MCEHCTPLTAKNFSSQKDFKTFEKVLETKCVEGTFVRVVNANETENKSLEDNYQCTFCGTDWVLSIDEGSWRGYFLPVEGVTVFEDHQTNETNSRFETFQGKRSKNCGCCLGMIFLFIALILYLIYSFASFVIDLFV